MFFSNTLRLFPASSRAFLFASFVLHWSSPPRTSPWSVPSWATAEFGCAAAAGRRAGKEVWRDGDVTGLSQLVGHAAHPIAEPEDFVDYDHGGGLVLDFGVGDEAIDLPVPVFDFHPFQVARRFFESGLGPILGGGRGDSQQRGEDRHHQ